MPLLSIFSGPRADTFSHADLDTPRSVTSNERSTPKTAHTQNSDRFYVSHEIDSLTSSLGIHYKEIRDFWCREQLLSFRYARTADHVQKARTVGALVKELLHTNNWCYHHSWRWTCGE